MELKVAYKQVHRTVIENKNEYKQRHFHDYSVITSRNLQTGGEEVRQRNPPTYRTYFYEQERRLQSTTKQW
eukprot:218184-Amphidinium_carterae.1